MTKPEAEALMVRLERIWEAEPIGPQHYSWGLKNGEFELVFDLPRRYRLRLHSVADSPFRTATIEHRHFFLLMRLHASGEFEGFPHHRFKQMLALKCVNTFRRNLWLSGSHIECSAHEQMEWTLWLRQIDEEKTRSNE